MFALNYFFNEETVNHPNFGKAIDQIKTDLESAEGVLAAPVQTDLDKGVVGFQLTDEGDENCQALTNALNNAGLHPTESLSTTTNQPNHFDKDGKANVIRGYRFGS